MYLTFDEFLQRGGTLDKTVFTPLENRAETLLDLATHNRVTGESPARESVRKAVFDLIGVLAQEAENTSNAVTGVSSKSNDGVSVTYANWATVTRYYKIRKREILVEHLANETVVIDGQTVPLLYAGVAYDGGDQP